MSFPRRIATALLCVMTCVAPSALRAQGTTPSPSGPPAFPTNDPVLRRLWTLGMDSSRVWPLGQALLDSVGPRLQGSPGLKNAQDWLVSQYQRWGITARNEQYGTWRGWRRGVSHVDLIAPRIRSLEARALAMSAPTKGEVTGAVIAWPDLADSAALKAWLPIVKGKFVAISFPQPTCRPDSNWERFATPASFEAMKKERTAASDAWTHRFTQLGITPGRIAPAKPLVAMLEAAGAAGILTSTWSQGWGVTRVFHSSSDKIPAFDVSCEDYGLLVRLAEQHQSPEIRVRVDAEYLGDAVPTFNTIATIPGEKADEYVLLSAHFDSWDGASGATDNGTGTLTMLEAMRLLKTVYPKPKRTIIVGHWSGEEWGLNGSRAFAEDHPEIVKGLQGVFNQDNGTGRVTMMHAGGLISGAPHLAFWLAQLPDPFSKQITPALPGNASSGGTDDFSFACHGAPTFGLGSLNWEYFSYTWHTTRDTFDKIVFDDLKANATLTAMLAYLAAEDPVLMTREQRVLAPDNEGKPRTWPVCPKTVRSWAENTR